MCLGLRALASIFVWSKFYIILHFTTGSGHHPLRIYHWSDQLHQNKFTMEYKPGCANSIADALSHLPRLAKTDQVHDLIAADEHFIHEIMVENIQHFITAEDLRVSTQADSVLQEMTRQMECGWKNPDCDDLHQYYNI